MTLADDLAAADRVPFTKSKQPKKPSAAKTGRALRQTTKVSMQRALRERGRGLVRANALSMPLRDGSVDLVVTSPPYFGLRSYTDGGEHYDGQIGSEPTPADFLTALWAVMDECWRVVVGGGSVWVNLGDKYAGSGMDVRAKSRMLLPHRFAEGCIDPDYRRWVERSDHVGPQWILRSDVVWEKVNGLPESVVDRVRASHEYWFHFTKVERYYANLDAIREAHTDPNTKPGPRRHGGTAFSVGGRIGSGDGRGHTDGNPLGKLPGSVWTVATEPLRTPEMMTLHSWGDMAPLWFDKTAAAFKWCEANGVDRSPWPRGAGDGPIVLDAPDHFACVDTDTEILTRRGWRRHDELTVGDQVAGYDLDDGLARWTSCSAIHRYEFDGDLVAVEKRDLSMRLTENHRTLVVRGGRERIVRADEIRPTDAIPRSAAWAQESHSEGIGMTVAALCGWIAAEGWYGATGTVNLSQSATANPDKVAAIDKLLASVPHIERDSGDRGISFEHGKYRARLQHDGRPINAGRFATRDEAAAALTAERERLGIDGLHRTESDCVWRGRPWVDVAWRLPRGFGDYIRRLMPDKLLTAELANLPLHEARVLFEAFVDGDGHRRVDGGAAVRISIYQKHRTNLDWLQMIAVRLGYRTTLTQEANRFILYCNEAPRPLTLRGTNGSAAPIPREHYRGVVWCPTTGTGTMIARRSGRVFITGQSFPTEWPRRLILGWSPPGVCTTCGEGRRATTATERLPRPTSGPLRGGANRSVRDGNPGVDDSGNYMATTTITGERCACPTPDAPTRPAVILDPFAGTGTTVLVAKALGRFGVGFDLSADYLRLARWRVDESPTAERTFERTYGGVSGMSTSARAKGDN